MSVQYVDDPREGERLGRSLRGQESIALDCEAAGFHRYTDRLSLIQLTAEPGTFLLDPFAFDPAPVLGPPLEDPGVEVVMHGADFDIRLLDRDLGLQIRGLFDTQVAAALLGEESTGLAALLEKHVGVRLSKKHQRADWAKRPLPSDMLEYAADDTRHLPALAGLMKERLRAAGRMEWVLEECALLERIRWEEPEEEDPVVRVKGARDLPPREVAALREALVWRDELARQLDRAPFRVAGDGALVAVVAERPSTPEELTEVKGFPSRLARGREGRDLINRLRAVRELPETDLDPYPRRESTGPGRPPPEVEALANRLKSVRNRRAEELGVDRGTLLPNATLLEIARREPRDAAELVDIPGVRRWQVEVVGEAVLAALDGKR